MAGFLEIYTERLNFLWGQQNRQGMHRQKQWSLTLSLAAFLLYSTDDADKITFLSIRILHTVSQRLELCGRRRLRIGGR